MKDRPTCVFMPDDFSAVGGLSMIYGMGMKIPDDISVIGYDGIPMSRAMFPRLTTLRQDTEQIGRIAAQELTNLIENPKTALVRKIMVKGEIQEGGTVRDISVR